MDLIAIKALIDAMAASDLAEMEFSENGWTLRLARGSAHAAPPVSRPAPPPVAAAPAQPGIAVASADVEAPLSGVVHLRPSPGEPPFVEAGQTVKAGDAVCVIEAMKVFNVVRAERGGTVTSLLVASGSEVEAGQILMRIA